MVAFRRGEQGFVRQVYERLSAYVELKELDIALSLAALSLAALYKRVEFGKEADEETW